MNWNELEVIWRRQKTPSTTTDGAEIRRTFEERHRKMRATLLVRNVAEGGTGLVLTPVITYLGTRQGTAAWPLRITAALLFAVTCVFVVDQLRIWRHRLGPGVPLLAKVDAELWELRHQRRLIQAWAWWYVSPCVVAITIGFIALSRLNFGKAPPGLLTEILTTPITLVWIVILLAVVGVALWRIWHANREAILKQIDPRIVELETLRGSMLRGESCEDKH
jgi:hypothetical protein